MIGAGLAILAMAANPPLADPAGAWIGELQLCENTVADITVAPATDGYGPDVHVTFTKEAAEKLAKLTQAKLDQELPITVDGEVVSTPVVREPIYAGQIVITGLEGGTVDRLMQASTATCAIRQPAGQ